MGRFAKPPRAVPNFACRRFIATELFAAPFGVLALGFGKGAVVDRPGGEKFARGADLFFPKAFTKLFWEGRLTGCGFTTDIGGRGFGALGDIAVGLAMTFGTMCLL